MRPGVYWWREAKIEFQTARESKEGKMNHARQIFDIVFLIGRIIAGGFFLMNGFNHFAKLGMMSGYAKSKGTPLPGLAVAGTGVLVVLGGASLLLGYHPTVGAILLVIFLLGVSFPIHNFWAVQEPQAKMTEMVNFMKNMALLGFVLMTVAIPRPWPMSLGHW
jgi:putative oxidoreductase